MVCMQIEMMWINIARSFPYNAASYGMPVCSEAMSWTSTPVYEGQNGSFSSSGHGSMYS